MGHPNQTHTIYHCRPYVLQKSSNALLVTTTTNLKDTHPDTILPTTIQRRNIENDHSLRRSRPTHMSLENHLSQNLTGYLALGRPSTIRPTKHHITLLRQTE